MNIEIINKYYNLNRGLNLLVDLVLILFKEEFKMKEKTIKALKVEPMKYPEEVKLINELSELQNAVGGLIEIINLDSSTCMICNEEGKLINLPGNRRLGNDIIAGTFYIVGSNKNGDLVSLPEDKIKLYKEMFYEPEEFSQEDIEAKLFFNFIDFD